MFRVFSLDSKRIRERDTRYIYSNVENTPTHHSKEKLVEIGRRRIRFRPHTHRAQQDQDDLACVFRQ